MEVSTSATTAIYIMQIATDTGRPRMDTGNEAIFFSSDVVIIGNLEVRSAKAKAIHLPKGGIHLSDPDDSPTAPGQMFAKKIKTSTITLVGSSIFFSDTNGVIKATMTASNLSIEGVSAGNIKNKNRGSGAPTAGLCALPDIGLQYISDTPARLYICVDDGLGGSEWRFTNLN